MSQIVKCVYGIGSSVCHSVAYALLRDLTNYYWQVEDAEFEKQQDLHSLIQEFPETETNEFIVEVTEEFTESTDNLVIAPLKKTSSKDTISTNNIVDNETMSPSRNDVLKHCSLCLENASDDSNHYRGESFGENIMSDNIKMELPECLLEENKSDKVCHNSFECLFEDDENKETYQTPLRKITCGDFVDSWTTRDSKNCKTDSNLESENNIVESHVLQETSSKEGSIIVLKKLGLGINDNLCYECDKETDIIDNEDDKTDTNPTSKSISSTNISVQENIKEGSIVLESPVLGIIETFNDEGSDFFDVKFLQVLIAKEPLECAKEEIDTDIDASVDMINSSKTCCLQALYFDAGDDMRNDLLSEDQLQTIETGSVSDWLYSVTSSPAVCLLHSDEILSVTQEEIESIQEQEEMYEICKATEEIMLKQSYVTQWLIDTNEYICSKQLFGDGDFI